MTRPLRRLSVALAALSAALAAPAWPQTCGDNAVQGDETCDDGNGAGGDGCAANCTMERRIAFAIGEGASFNVQGRLNRAYAPPGLRPRGALTLTVGAPRAGDAAGVVPFVILASDARIEPVPLAATACFCARPVVPAGFPDGIVARGLLGCGAGGLPEVDYRLAQDHDIGDVDPACETGTPQGDGHCTGPRQRTFSAGGGRGAANAEMGFSFYELSDCDGTPGDPDARGCTADDPVPVPAQTLLLTTGTALGEIADADGTASVIGPGQSCGASACETGAAGAPFDCDALLADPPAASGAALGGIDVAVHSSVLPDLIAVLRLPLLLSPGATPTPTASGAATATPTPPAAACAGDCDGSGAVGIEELIRGVSIALGALPLTACPRFDASGDQAVSVDELIQAVGAALNGCPQP